MADEQREFTPAEHRVLDAIAEMETEGKSITVMAVKNRTGCTKDMAAEMLQVHRGTESPKQRLATLEAQLDELRAQVAQLEQQRDQARAERDDALAARERAKEQAAEFRGAAQSLTFAVAASSGLGESVRELLEMVRNGELVAVAASSGRPADDLPTGDPERHHDGAGEVQEAADEQPGDEDEDRASSGRPADGLPTAEQHEAAGAVAEPAESAGQQSGGDPLGTSSGRPAADLPTSEEVAAVEGADQVGPARDEPKRVRRTSSGRPADGLRTAPAPANRTPFRESLEEVYAKASREYEAQAASPNVLDGLSDTNLRFS